jgi:2,3-bisphosphoglycerate-independent phosphoglycerate mutase
LNLDLMRELSISTESKIVLLVLDGLGGLPDEQGRTELEAASAPNLDALASRSDLGLSRPLGPQGGVSPGSGPGHLGLFGYDPIQYAVGRGILSALGVGLELGETDLAARINFATKDGAGRISDRRAGRIESEKAAKLVDRLQSEVDIDGVEVVLAHEKEHRAVVLFRGERLGDALTDTDPQRTGLEAFPVRAEDSSSKRGAEVANEFVAQANGILADESPANTVLLRGFGMNPALPQFSETYRLTPAAIAGYPMYKGLARLAGMQVLQEGEGVAGEFETLRQSWDDHDFFFLHVKYTDSSGEDGDHRRKSEVIEQVDSLIPGLLELGPDALAVTGDHGTPAKLMSHSWHGVPFMLHSPYTLPTADSFGERTCAGGSLGTFAAEEIMGLLMGHALKLNRYGA